MTTTNHEAAPPDPASSLSPDSYERLSSPSLRMAWLLRTTAVVAVVSSVLGSIVVPGLPGLASEAVISKWETVSAGVAYTMALLLVGLMLTGAVDLSRARRVGIASRVFLFLGAPGVVAMLVPAFTKQLGVYGTMILVVATLFVVLGGVVAGLRPPHTRALALTELLLAIVALVRIAGWMIGHGESLRAYHVSRAFSVAAIVIEGICQGLVVVWLSTRRRMSSSIAATLALLAAFMMVWAVNRVGPTSATWLDVVQNGIGKQVMPNAQSVLHALEVFFVMTSMTLALACVFLRGHLAVVLCALALTLLSQGAFDVPLHALAAAVAALWTALAAVDERALWKTLTER